MHANRHAQVGKYIQIHLKAHDQDVYTKAQTIKYCFMK